MPSWGTFDWTIGTVYCVIMTPPIVAPVHTEEIQVPAQDGFPLSATLFRPQDEPKGLVVLSSGTGIRRQYYRHLATYLAQQGFQTLSYDYRGIGQSRPNRLRGFQADLTDWGQLDMQGVIDYALSFGKPVSWIGHSAGAQLVGLAPGAERLKGVISIAAGAGYWRQMEGSYRWFCAAMWYGFVPLSTSLLGYAPAQAIGQGQDLPAGVAREWARWCRSADYFGDHLSEAQIQRLASLEVPWLSLSFSDDNLAGPAASSTCSASIRVLGLNDAPSGPMISVSWRSAITASSSPAAAACSGLSCSTFSADSIPGQASRKRARRGRWSEAVAVVWP